MLLTLLNIFYLFGRVWSYLTVIESSIYCSPIELKQKLGKKCQDIGTYTSWNPRCSSNLHVLLTGKHFVRTGKSRRGWHWQHDSRALGRHRDAGPGPLVQAFLCGLQRVCWNPGPVDRTASAARPLRWVTTIWQVPIRSHRSQITWFNFTVAVWVIAKEI